MDGISVYSEDTRTTWVPNEFIDSYMPRANGTFVKVYIYLLRCLSVPSSGIGISAIADALEETEKDILRALRYWEKEKVLTLNWKNDSEISGIKLHRLSKPVKEPLQAFVSVEDIVPTSTSVAPDFSSSASNTAAKAEPAQQATKAAVEKNVPDYSAEQLDAFSENAETSWLLVAVEKYLERMLKPADVQLILFFHEELHFSNELILHLYDYCVNRGKKTNSYIQKVGISWFENGIDSVEKAEVISFQFDASFSAVNRAFGLNRAPGAPERRYINQWTSLGFGPELIEEACNRTILTTSRPDFKYADKILENWHAKNVRTLADVTRLDREHAAARPTGAMQQQSQQSTSGNRFNAFPQREYSGAEMSALESALLKTGRTE